MMAIDSRRLSRADEVLGDRSVEKALRQRAANRLQDLYLAMASGAAGWAAGEPSARRWYVLTVSNRAEKDVEKSLLDVGVEAWLPMKKGDPKRRGCRPIATRKAVLMPAFPGYVFVSVVPCDEAIHGLLGVKFVTGILGDRDGRPSPVADRDVNKLKKMVDDGKLDQTVEARALRRGDRVSIKDGPFAWHEGDIDRIDEAREGYAGSMHVRVMLSLFGRAVPVRLDLAQIAKLD